jgi:hypothetical protein
MKKLLLLFIFLLIPVGLRAADVLETWDDYSVAARRSLGYDTVSTGLLTDANARAFIRVAVIQIVPISQSRKEITSFITTYKNYTYDLDTSLTKILSVWWSKNDSIKTLLYKPISQWSLQEHKATTGDNNPLLKRPSFYDFTDSLILVYPAPSDVFGDTIRIMGTHRIRSVLTDSTLDEIPQIYRPSVLNYITWSAANARQDSRSSSFFDLLGWSLSHLGRAIKPGGQVVPANQ